MKCLKIGIDQLKKDPALSKGERGARKIIVTEIFKDKEEESKTDVWIAPLNRKCQVLGMSNAEMAFFNEEADQDSHYHKEGTEIYMVIKGELFIDVDGTTYQLQVGDTIVVYPFSVHKVKNKDNLYLCRVITLNCGGEDDKFTV